MDRVRKYPIGIQTFSEIIRSGYVYVDKTDLVWQLAHYAKLPSSAFDKPTEAMTTALPLLYQSGYLTIKYYDPEMKQIDDKGYAIPYQTDGRRVVKVGVSVDADTRTIKDWNVAY